MRIIRLQAENVKRLRAVAIRPEGSVVLVGGLNGQGKSSVLDSITYALGGKDVQPPKVIRSGEHSARVVLELDDLVVERRWKDDGTTTLVVRNREGAIQRSPQGILDSLVGRLTFDPLAFSRLDKKAKADTLRQLVGLDFKEMDRERETHFTTRTAVNRNVKQLEALLAKMPVDLGAPAGPVSTADLLAEQQSRLAVKAANDQKRNALEHTRNVLAAAERRRDELVAALRQAEAAVAAAQDAEWKAQEAAADLVDPNLTELVEKIQAAEAQNGRHAAAQRRAEEAAKLKAAQDESDRLTDAIGEIDKKKAKMLREAPYPVPGLALDSEGVTYNGVPLEQAATSEQLRVSLAMGLALNPKLKVMLIREGSLLDANSMRIVHEMADTADAQVWVETVSEGEGAGVVMEDGQARGPEVEQELQPEEAFPA